MSAGSREFFAVRAAKWLGAAAQKAGASIARLAAGPSAKALRADLEARASAPSAEARAAAVVEWARLLAAPDDTPRYEDPDGGGALTFRAAFLDSQAWELLLAAAASDFADSGAKATATPGDSSWRNFLSGVAVAGGEDLALQLPELLAQARHLPDCRQRVEQLAAALKADARHEALRSRCTVAGTRAEEIRTSLRAVVRRSSSSSGAAAASPQQGGGQTGGDSPDELCSSSAEAVRLYSVFRSGLAESTAHLQKVLADRAAGLQAAGEALRRLTVAALEARTAAEQRRAQATGSREKAAAGPRREVEELERDTARLETEARGRELEERRRQLQIELEEVSQALAAKRQDHQALGQRREDAMAEHRKKAEAVEKELQALRPATFHKVLSSRAETMTESEIASGIARSADLINALTCKLLSFVDDASMRRALELDKQRDTIVKQGSACLQKHAKLELARLEAAGTAVAEAVAVLLEVAQSRAQLAALGVSPEHEEAYAIGSVPDRRDVRRLRIALAEAKNAWQEAACFWGGTPDVDIGSTGEGSMPSVALAAEAPEELVSSVLAALEAARGRISQSLVPLQRADPALFEIAIGSGGDEDEGDEDEANIGEAVPLEYAHLPHGWEAHVAPSGHIYYHNLVSQSTQWEEPDQDAAVSAGWRLFQAESGNWFYHNPYDGSGVWWPELPKCAATPTSLDALRLDTQ